MFAIIETGGKQYKVEPGMRVSVERIEAQPGETVELDRVLMIGGDGPVTVGTPSIDGAKVRAFVVDQGRAKKILVFKYKAKSNYRRKTGHRQAHTRLRVTEIVGATTAAPPSAVGTSGSATEA